jgi:antitoxin (DNA-binding transcriptional repressor) of toxin-antitoxin stability system
VEITDRGRPIARLVPITGTSPLEQLRVQGRLTEPDGDLFDLGPPLRAASAQRASDRLEAARADDR